MQHGEHHTVEIIYRASADLPLLKTHIHVEVIPFSMQAIGKAGSFLKGFGWSNSDTEYVLKKHNSTWPREGSGY